MLAKTPPSYEADLSGAGLRVALACSRFNRFVTDALVQGAADALAGHGAQFDVVWAPGAFELPLVAKHLAESGQVDAVVCLGAVIRGETGHYEQVATQCAAGIQRAQLDTGVPIVFGVLTTENVEQATRRADPKGENKGAEVACAALEMVNLLRTMRAV